jgi:hypothetical protein
VIKNAAACRARANGHDKRCLQFDRMPSPTEAGVIREALGIRRPGDDAHVPGDDRRHTGAARRLKNWELKMTRTKRLTQALLADRHRGAGTERTDITNCFMCGYGMLNRGSRFCSDRCRDFYDAGEPGHEQNWLRGPKTRSLPLTQPKIIAGPPGIEIGSFHHHLADLPATSTKCTVAGYMVRCAGCGKEFESRGLRCCSGDCWRRYKQRQEISRLWPRPASSRCRRSYVPPAGAKSRFGATAGGYRRRPDSARRNAPEPVGAKTRFLSLKR